jgi:hypothetical protein
MHTAKARGQMRQGRIKMAILSFDLVDANQEALETARPRRILSRSNGGQSSMPHDDQNVSKYINEEQRGSYDLRLARKALWSKYGIGHMLEMYNLAWAIHYCIG